MRIHPRAECQQQPSLCGSGQLAAHLIARRNMHIHHTNALCLYQNLYIWARWIQTQSDAQFTKHWAPPPFF